MANKNQKWSRYAWLVFALVIIGLSLAGLRAGAISHRLSNAPQLVSAAELSKESGLAADARSSIPAIFTEAPLPSLLSLIQPPAGCGASFDQASGSPVGAGSFPFSLAVGDFNLGHNLHTLILSGAASYVIPVFPPSC